MRVLMSTTAASACACVAKRKTASPEPLCCPRALRAVIMMVGGGESLDGSTCLSSASLVPTGKPKTRTSPTSAGGRLAMARCCRMHVPSAEAYSHAITERARRKALSSLVVRGFWYNEA